MTAQFFNTAIILWFFMLAFVVAQLTAIGRPWSKLAVWLVLVLITVVLVLLKAVVFHG